MTDSRIERLLEQMSVKQPSAALDVRVEDCLRACVDAPESLPLRSGSWPVLTLVAVASLLIGIAVGRSSPASRASAEHPGAGTRSATPVIATDLDPRSDAVPKEFSADDEQRQSPGAAMVTVSINSEEWREHLRGPNLNFMCALGGPSRHNEKALMACISCHAGLSDAHLEFTPQHVRQLDRTTCEWCHAGVENL